MKAELFRATGNLQTSSGPSLPAVVASRLTLGGERVRSVARKPIASKVSAQFEPEDELEPALAASWVSLQRKASTYEALHSAGGLDDDNAQGRESKHADEGWI